MKYGSLGNDQGYFSGRIKGRCDDYYTSEVKNWPCDVRFNSFFCKMLGKKIRRRQIYCNYSIKLLDRDFISTSTVLDSGIIHQNIDSAVMCNQLAHGVFTFSFPGNIAANHPNIITPGNHVISSGFKSALYQHRQNAEFSLVVAGTAVSEPAAITAGHSQTAGTRTPPS